MSSVASNVRAAHDWLYYQLAAFGLCGPWSVNERSGETCLGLGLMLALYLLTPTNLVGKYVKPERAYAFLTHLISLAVLIGNLQAGRYTLWRTVVATASPFFVMHHLTKKNRLSSVETWIVRGVARLCYCTGFVRSPLRPSTAAFLEEDRRRSPEAYTKLDDMLFIIAKEFGEESEW
jgi:hypothetical protein